MAFKDPYPASYNPANQQVGQYADVVPDMTLPINHIFVGGTTNAAWNQPLMVQKGFTHYDRTKASYESGNGNENFYITVLPGKKFLNAVRVNDSFGMTTSTTQAQAEAFADTMPLDCTLAVLETQEGNPYLAPNAIQWKWFHDRWKARCDAQTAIDGFKRYRCHNYFRFTNGIFALGYQDWELHRQLYTTPVSGWPGITYVNGAGDTVNATNEYSDGFTLSATNLITEGAYFNNPDADTEVIARMMFSMDVSRMQGKACGIFAFGVREWRPAFYEGSHIPGQGSTPSGTFFRLQKHKIDPDTMILLGFISQEFGREAGSCGVEYGVIDYQPAAKRPIDYYAPVHSGTDLWIKDGETGFSAVPSELYGGTGPGRWAFGGGDDFSFGVKYWNDTMGEVAAANPVFLRYRVNDGAWVEKSASESDLVDMLKFKRGIARGRVVGNVFSFWWCNLWANHTKIKLEVQHPTNPSLTYVRYPAGNGVFAEKLNFSQSI